MPCWDNILTINTGTMSPNWLSKKLSIVNIWLLWIPLPDPSQSILDINVISGWWLSICLIMNPCSLSITPSCKDIWNISNPKCRNKFLGWLNLRLPFTLIFLLRLEKRLWISIMNSIYDIFRVSSKVYWWLNPPNSKPLIRLSNCGSMNPKEYTEIVWWLWKILPNTRASCLIYWKNRSVNLTSNVISNKTNPKTWFSVISAMVFQENVNTT